MEVMATEPLDPFAAATQNTIEVKIR